jgi:hypothetical protein
VLVGIIDTGIDATHPDIAPNFVPELSMNFTTDIEAIDGPCAEEPDASCSDPATVARTVTARTWRGPSPRRSTTSAWPVWRPASGW